MTGLGVLAVVLLYILVGGVSLLITFWIIRTAILSALAEDRRRNGLTPHAADPAHGPTGKHWLDEDGR